MLRRLGVRGKILAVLAVPMLVILAAGGFISLESLRDLRSARATASVVDVLQAYLPMARALETEAAASMTGATAEQIAAARTATDEALEAVRPVTARVDLAEFPTAVVAQFTEAQRALNNDLTSIRHNVDIQARPQVIQSGYARLVDNQFLVVDGVAQNVTNRELASYLSAYLLAARTSHNLVTELIDGHNIMASATDSPASGASFTQTVTQTELYRTSATNAIGALNIPGVALTYRDPTTAYTRARTLLGQGTLTAVAQVDPVEFQTQVTAQNDRLDAAISGVLAGAATVAQEAITAQEQRTYLTIALAALGALLSILLALLVARTIVVPLRRLTAAAADVRDELPRLVEQVSVPGEGPEMELPHIPVTSNDEVGRLAAAFNAVNTQTIKVAQEQAILRGSIAEMFVNVARRDQVLLNRQLSFIDSLERSEEDPQALANLFRLDHLATRMRRNAESLLVLAGIDSGRRLRDSLPLSDVVRTASSEIEQYDRVQLDLQADPHMLGFNALPAAHLLAELLENATVFSEPETAVMVTTGVVGDHVVVRIIDQGLGMSEAELAAANLKIASATAGEALGAQRLGLYVVGRIAQRLGAEVKMSKSSLGSTGTETIVRFPSGLFQSTEVSPLGGYGAPLSMDAETGAFEAPVVAEVDLAALTDGQTQQGLPRRRSVDAPAGLVEPPPAVTGAGLPARARKTFDADNLVLPETPAGTLSPEVQAGRADWAPAQMSDAGNDLPSRARATSAWANPASPGVPPAPIRPVDTSGRPTTGMDPAARAGMFAGFRGRSAIPSVPPAPADVPQVPQMVVPGLAPDEPDQVDQPDQGVAPVADEANLSQVALSSMSFPALADDESLAPEAHEWVAADTRTAPAWSAPDMPQWSAPEEPLWTPTPDLPVAAEPAAWTEPVAAEPAAWAQPVAEPVAAPIEPVAEPAAWAEPVAEPATVPAVVVVSHADVLAAPLSESWHAPAVDVEQWATAAEQPPVFEPMAPAALVEAPAPWSAPAADVVSAPEPYVPFERSADEARAWVTGSMPVVDEPAGFPAAVAEQAPPDDWAAPAWQPPSWSTPTWLQQADATAVAPATPDVEPVTPDPFGAPQLAAEPLTVEQLPAGQGGATTWSATPWTAAAEPVAETAPVVGQAWAPVEQFDTPWTPSVAPDQGVQLEPDFVPEPEPVAVAPVVEAEPEPLPEVAQPAAAQARPAWAPQGVPSSLPATDFAALVNPVEPVEKPRRGLFGRKKRAVVPLEQLAAVPGVTPVAGPAAAPQVAAPPVRTPVWSSGAAVILPEPEPAGAPAPAQPSWGPRKTWSVASLSDDESAAPTVSAPPPPPPPAVVETPVPTAPVRSQDPSWSMSEWTPRAVPSQSSSSSQSVPTPSVAPRVGTLDDEVAAMLALRSDIQEQALSELSQLSAYRPRVVNGNEPERLVKRVPTAIPDAPEFTDVAKGGDRDADKLRSRLSSFQSGTARGRRDAGQDAEPS